MTNVNLEIIHVNPAHLGSIVQKLRDTGVKVETGSASMTVQGNGQLRAADVATKEYPGFATDMQAQYMALMTQSVGTSVITENIFENRFMHASELMRLGAGASLVIADLVADGTTIIDRVYHLDRGYEKIEEKLRSAGANIERLK